MSGRRVGAVFSIGSVELKVGGVVPEAILHDVRVRDCGICDGSLEFVSRT